MTNFPNMTRIMQTLRGVRVCPIDPNKVLGRTSNQEPPFRPLPSPQPKGDTARKTDPMDIPTLNEQQASCGIADIANALSGTPYKSVKPAADNVATSILAKARQHMLDRAATYDKPGGERSMAQTVNVFNAYTKRDLSEHEGWLFMDVLKTVRDLTGEKPHRDSLEDKVAYGSLYAESRLSGVAPVVPTDKEVKVGLPPCPCHAPHSCAGYSEKDGVKCCKGQAV